MIFVIIGLFIPHYIFAQEDNGLEQAIQYYEDGNLTEAKRIFQTHFEVNPRSGETAYYLGRILWQEGNPDEAHVWLERAVRLDDESSNAHLWLGNFYGYKAQKAGLLKKAGWAKKMKREVERAVALDENNLDARFTLLQFYTNAPGFMGGGKDKARVQASEIKKRDLAYGHRAFALLYQVESKPDSAIMAYRAIEAVYVDSPEHYQFYNEFGYFLLRQKQVEEAIEKFEKQVALAPEDANAYDSLGDGYKAAERWEDAAQAYRRALEIDPEFESSKNNLKDVEKKL